MKAETREFIG